MARIARVIVSDWLIGFTSGARKESARFPSILSSLPVNRSLSLTFGIPGNNRMEEFSGSTQSSRPNRMSVMLTDDDTLNWLAVDDEIAHALSLLKPNPLEKMEGYDVSTFVNITRNDTPECIRPMER